VEERGAPLYTVESTNALIPWDEYTIEVNELKLEKDIIISSTRKDFYGCEHTASSFKFSTPGASEKALLRGSKRGFRSINTWKTVPIAQMPGSMFYKPRGALSGMLASNDLQGVPQQKRFHCKFCPKIFSYRSLLSRHLLKHNGISTNHNCKICWKSFSSMTNLNVHSQLHIMKQGKPYQCSYCQKRFVNHIGMQRHMRIHTGEKPYKCNQCGRRFAQKGHLTRHLVYRENEIDKPLKCDYCCRRFSSQRSVSKHRRVHFPKICHPTKEHVNDNNDAETAIVDVRDSGHVIEVNSSYVDVKVSNLIVKNVGG